MLHLAAHVGEADVDILHLLLFDLIQNVFVGGHA
jgi:hypothetical protein